MLILPRMPGLCVTFPRHISILILTTLSCKKFKLILYSDLLEMFCFFRMSGLNRAEHATATTTTLPRNRASVIILQ